MKPSKLTLLAATTTLAICSIYATKPTAKRGAPTKVYLSLPYSVTLVSGGTYPHLTTGVTPKRIYFGIGAGIPLTMRTGAFSTSKTIYLK